MFKPVRKLELVIIFVITTAGCASVGNEKQCQEGDWIQVGFNDGINGQSLESSNTYEAVCAHYENTNLDRTQYRQGWLTGNEIYCKPEHGYVIGLRGEQYAGVCTSTSGQNFLDNYIKGYGTFLLTSKLNNIEAMLSDINRNLYLQINKQDHNHQNLLYRIKALEQKLKKISSAN